MPFFSIEINMSCL